MLNWEALKRLWLAIPFNRSYRKIEWLMIKFKLSSSTFKTLWLLLIRIKLLVSFKAELNVAGKKLEVDSDDLSSRWLAGEWVLSSTDSLETINDGTDMSTSSNRSICESGFLWRLAGDSGSVSLSRFNNDTKLCKFDEHYYEISYNLVLIYIRFLYLFSSFEIKITFCGFALLPILHQEFIQQF